MHSLAIRLFAATLLATLMLGTQWQSASAIERPSVKVALIVGPVGDELTPQYIEMAEMAAAAAERSGAQVARAYSPDATPERVMEVADGASIIVYFGHGTGFPNPYSQAERSDVVNGWGLQGPAAHGTHADSWQDGTLQYFGEAWIAANIHPAPGFVMMYSNACYAPGASEGWLTPPTYGEASAHVANYSKTPLVMGASAYFATDFSGGAAGLIERLLSVPALPYGDVFRGDPQFAADALRVAPHPSVAGGELWMHRSPYFGGQLNYWYAFAGNPRRTFEEAGSSSAGTAVRHPAAVPAAGMSGSASAYGFTHGFEGRATVGLPAGLAGPVASGDHWVAVCADRCSALPVVDGCDCYWGTPDERIVNLSNAAWRLISDQPLERGLIPVTLYLDGRIPPGAGPTPLVQEVDPPTRPGPPDDQLPTPPGSSLPEQPRP
jgi:hypothetical protein